MPAKKTIAKYQSIFPKDAEGIRESSLDFRGQRRILIIFCLQTPLSFENLRQRPKLDKSAMEMSAPKPGIKNPNH
jgi:hypothetical protein